jgi:hypothetical protein
MKQFQFDENTMRVIEDIRKKSKYKDNAEVVAKALTLLKLATDAAVIGGTTVIGGKEVVL